MAKRKQAPPDEGSPAWMSTFSDLMNLLLCFFVLLFASSTMDEGKIQKIMASFSDASFSILEQGSVSLVDGQIVSGGVTQLPGIESILEYIGVSSEVKGNNQDLSATGSGENDATEDQGEETTSGSATEETTLSEKELKAEMEQKGEEQSQQMYDEISQMTENYSIDDMVAMDFNSQYVSLDLNGALLFSEGSADLKDDSKLFLQKIAAILEKYQDCVIEIEGHTDNVPIHNSRFESNRYLSTARATKVYEYISEQTDLPDANLKVAGYGDSRPVASNATEEGREKNRRVSIKIYNQLNSETQTEE